VKTRTHYDEAVADRADTVIADAIDALLIGRCPITLGEEQFSVVVVAAPAGAGKSFFVCSVAEAAVAAHPDDRATVLIGTPTNDQAHALVRSLALRLPSYTVAFVPARNRNLPADIVGLPNIVEIAAADAHHYQVVVGTLDKLGDAHGRGDLTPGFRYLCVDEAYQAHSAHYYGIAGLASRHLLVGDPGQLDPFTTMDDPDRWRGLAEDPTQTAVGVVRRNHPQVPVFRLPITRRLPPSAVPMVRAFYPGHPFDSWTTSAARSLRLLPGTDRGSDGPIDATLDAAASAGWGYLRLPNTPVLTADPMSIEVITRLAVRLSDRRGETRCERTRGAWTVLGDGRIAVAVSHNDQKDHLRASLDAAGLADVKVDTANKLQGLEFDLLIAWHPLAGLPEADGFHLDPGRLCVMLTRHRHACVVVGRADDVELIDAVPPPSDAWIGHNPDPEVDGWFAQRLVFDQLARHAIDL
jgi:hypothetical protein